MFWIKHGLAGIAALGLVISPALAQTRSAMALPAVAQGVSIDECRVRPDIPGDVARDRDKDGLIDNCGANRAARANRAAVATSGGAGLSPALLLGLLAVVGAIVAAAGGGGGGNDSPG